jgi:signal transduction histidine kinase/ligand-binding sensor domain-containing protein
MSKRRLAVAVLILAGSARAAFALDPHRAPSQYVVTRWGARDLGSGSVHALHQTRDGYLWLGTTTSLVRFDGARFVVFNSRRTPGFIDGGASSLAQSASGRLYVGSTSGETMQYENGIFSRLPAPRGSGFVTTLLPARDGSLWGGTHGVQVFRWAQDSTDPQVHAANIKGPLAMVEDATGRIWIGTGDGLVRYSNGLFTPMGPSRDTVQALHFDRAGTLWLGTPHGLIRARDGETTRFSRAEGLSHDNVSAILEDRDGNLWIGTAGGGLNRFREGGFSHFTVEQGLSNDFVQRLLEDHEGNLWVGTADGVSCLSDGRFVSYGRLEGLRDPSVTAVAPSADGSVWIGMNSGGLARLRGGRLEHFDLPSSVGRDAIMSLFESRDGSLWVAPDNGRLFRLKGGAVTEHTPTNSTEKVRLIFEDEKGPIVFVSRLGLVRVQDRKAIPLHPGSRRLGYVYAAHYDSQGTLWMGTTWGLIRMKDGKYDLYNTEHGLPRDRVRSMTSEPDGSLWLATVGGLSHFKDGRARTLTTAHGLPENLLRLVLDDGQGHLWIASMGSLCRVAKSDVLDVLDGRATQVSPVAFDVSDGLRSTESVLSNAPGFRHGDGRMWFSTAQGVSVVDPARITVGDPAPQVRVEGLTVDSVRGLGVDEFKPGRGEVTIDYTAVRFHSWSKLFFRYRLEGLDDNWVSADTRRTAYYSNLPPGRYRFLVMASNRDGGWTGEPTTLSFTILPPFYRQPVFYAACVALVAGIVAAAHRLRVNQMRERFAIIIDERTRIARELHDTLAQGLAGLGIQIDTALSILPDENRLHRVRQQMEQGLGMVRTSLAEVRRSIWVLRAQTAKDARDLASSLAENLSHLTAEAGIASSFELTGAPRVLSSDLERNLLRIAHEAVINAVRHAGAKRITVALHFDDDDVRLVVRDDGQGFDPETRELKPRGDHFGLAGISERTRSLGGELRLESRPGAGTEIDCRLPYDHSEAQVSEGVEGVSL